MQLSEDTPLTQLLVTSYEEGIIWVHHKPYYQPIILTPQEVKPWQGDLHELLAYEVQVVLIGSKDYIHLQTAETLALFYEKKIGVEIMNVQAACRTYNLLANEGRKVVAGLII